MLATMFVSPPVGTVQVEASLAVSEARPSRGASELNMILLAAQKRLSDAREVRKAATDLQGRIRAGAEKTVPAQRQATIELLLGIEASLDAARRKLVAKARENEAEAAATAPHLVPILAQFTAATDELFVIYCEACRDLRWELMAKDADEAPPANGPVLSTPDELEHYFDTLDAEA